MLTTLRSVWRRARTAPLIGRILSALDRLWWARAIRNSHVVDLDFVRTFAPSISSERAAIRHYVRGGFARGFSLSPLFLERYVSQQLPDSERVPALYAYVVADSTDGISTTPAWDASSHARAHPDSVRHPGGILGHASAMLRRGERITLRSGSTISRNELFSLQEHALREALVVNSIQGARRTLLCIEMGLGDEDATVLTTVIAFLDAVPASSAVLNLSAGRADVRHAAYLMALGDPRIHVTTEDVSRLRAVSDVVIRRAHGTTADVNTLLALRVAAAETQDVVAPVLLATDGTVASAGGMRSEREAVMSLLAGFPREDLNGLGASLPVYAVATALTARRANGGVSGARVLLSHSAVVADQALSLTWEAPESTNPAAPLPALTRQLSFEAGRSGIRIIRSRRETFTLSDGETVPRLRWSVKTAAPAGSAGESWGDVHFARALSRALERLGQFVAVDALAAAHRPSSTLDDVTLVLRGPERISPPPGPFSMLWVISHPDEITASEVSEFDSVFAASESWSQWASSTFGVAVKPLLQCTDPARFHPRALSRDGSIVFVGTARGIHRPAVVGPVNAGIPVQVYGPDWRGYIPSQNIVANGIPNEELAARYESASVILNDHWPEMHRHGFISNRIYDVLGAGGRVISDDVPGISHVFQGVVPTFGNVEELVEMLRTDFDALFPDPEALTRVSALVRERDSFDARAREILSVALRKR